MNEGRTKLKNFLGRLIGLGLLLLGTVVHGQEEALVIHPALSQSFSLKVTAEGVRVSFPVLLNDHTVLGMGAVLRFIYIDSHAGIHPRGGGGGSGGRRGDEEMSTAAPRGPSSAVNPDIQPIVDTSDKSDKKGSASELRSEIWSRPDLFREALDHAADLGTTVVYNLPNKTHPESATIDFPEGLFLGEVEAHVRVLALTDDSRAGEGGVQPGDEIRSLQGKPVATLEDFLKAYLVIKQAALESGLPSYTMEVWRPSEAKTISVRVEAPPSIHSLL